MMQTDDVLRAEAADGGDVAGLGGAGRLLAQQRHREAVRVAERVCPTLQDVARLVPQPLHQHLFD